MAALLQVFPGLYRFQQFISKFHLRVQYPQETNMEKSLRNIFIGLGAVSVVILGSVYYFTGRLEGFWVNVATEIVGIVLTIAFIDYYYRQREKKVLLENLVRELGSKDNAVAIAAIGKLSSRGWLQDGSLAGKSFIYANLDNANLILANFENCYFGSASFRNSILHSANFKNANLHNADFRDASLFGANLEGATLQNANFNQTKLRGANLHNTDLSDEQLALANTLRDAIMPDGQIYNGRFRLPEDVKAYPLYYPKESDDGYAEYFGVTIGSYQAGQKWADKHLHKYRKDEE
jgi:hypothetical protein